jgi:hypothetical protein
MKEFINNFLEPLSPLLPLLLFLFNFRKARATVDLRLLFFVYLVLFILNLMAAIYAYFDTTNIWIYDLICITAFITISFYLISILRSETRRKIIYFFLPVYIAFFLGYTYVLGYNSLFNSISFAALSLLISTYCVLFFVEKLTRMEEEHLQDSYSFWVVTSFFVYYLGSFFIFLTFKHLSSQGASIGILWGLHNIIYFISCSIAAYGLWKQFQMKFI